MAAAIGVREEPGGRGALLEHVAGVLRTTDTLLVLDNCEQLVEPVAAVVARLLQAAPQLRVLATSREPLGVGGETLWAVPPLDVPAADSLTAVQQSTATQLFVARAAAAAPGFTLDAGNAAAVAALCRRLDGMPLALELAATRIRTLGVAELLSRLDDRFRLLRAERRRDLPARQQTLRATIDWSWELLTGAERIVLRRLAVHADGCGLDAAEAVCAGGEVAADDVLDLLARLVDRSLVVADHRGPAPRYRLLETVAAYALERLHDAGEAEGLRLRHAHHYAALAERAAARLRGPDQGSWLERLDAESPNLRAALDTAVQRRDGALALRIATALTWYWFLRGRLGEARRALATAAALPGPAAATAQAAAWQAGLAVLDGEPRDDVAFAGVDAIDDPTERARALWFLGYVLSTVGDMGAGEHFTRRALADFRALDDRWGIAATLSDRFSQAMTAGDFPAAEAAALGSAKLFAEIGDRWGQVQASFALGTLASLAGDYDRAARHHHEGLQWAEALGLWPEVSYQLSWLGRVSLLTGRPEQAQEYHERPVRLAVEQGSTTARVYAQIGLALGARSQGRLDEAEKHLHEVLRWHRQVGFEPGAALVLAELGFVAEHRGDAEAAARLHREGLAMARRTGNPRAVALALEGLAGAHALAGEAERVARLLGAASRARESVGRPLPAAERGDVDRIAAAARRSLGDQEFARAFARGEEAGPDGVPE